MTGSQNERVSRKIADAGKFDSTVEAPPAIAAKSLSQLFGHHKALDNITFTLPRGAFLTIFGPNGAGKTTLLRLLATLDRPAEGSLFINGIDSTKAPDEVRQTIGMVSHQAMLYPDLTAFENLILFGELYGVDDCQARALELLHAVGLRLRRDDRVRTFSRGMTQRLAIARTLMHDPSLILLDEPYAGLDPQGSAVFDELLASLRDGRTFAMVSHDPNHGLALCSHGLLLAGGRMQAFEPQTSLKPEQIEALYKSDTVAGKTRQARRKTASPSPTRNTGE